MVSGFVDVANWLFTSGQTIFSSLVSQWGIIGVGIVATFLLVRVSNFMHRFFR